MILADELACLPPAIEIGEMEQLLAGSCLLMEDGIAGGTAT